MDTRAYSDKPSQEILEQAKQNLIELTNINWVINEKGHLCTLPDKDYANIIWRSIGELELYGVYAVREKISIPNEKFPDQFWIISHPLEINALAKMLSPPTNVDASKAIAVLKKITGHEEWVQENQRLYLRKPLQNSSYEPLQDSDYIEPRDLFNQEMIDIIVNNSCFTSVETKNNYNTKYGKNVYGATIKITHSWDIFGFSTKLDGICSQVFHFELARHTAHSPVYQVPTELTSQIYDLLLKLHRVTLFQPRTLIQEADKFFSKAAPTLFQPAAAASPPPLPPRRRDPIAKDEEMCRIC